MTTPKIEFHNIHSPEPWEFGPGMLLPRYPRHVREAMNEGGRVQSAQATGVELRFATKATNIRVYLSSPEIDGEVTVFCGGFQHSAHKLPAGLPVCIHLTPPDRFPVVTPETIRTGPFSPEIWRIIASRSTLVFRGLNTYGHAVRPPTAEEKPRLKWLAYGSSITHSSWKGYPQQAAWRLGVDVQNKGLSGSCHVEDTTANFLARQCDWDFATLEMGINMREKFTAEEFARRARYIVEEFTTAKPGQPVVLITVFPNNVQYQTPPPPAWEREQAFNESVRSLAKEFASRNVHLVEGSEVLGEFTNWGIDLLHPSEFGHVRMGENLANALKPIIAGL